MSSEKSEKPTRRRLRKARERGQVVRSTDVIDVAAFAACVGLLAAGAGSATALIGRLLRAAMHVVQIESDGILVVAKGLTLGVEVLVAVLAPVLLVTACAGISAGFVQVRGVFSMHPLIPSAERINVGINLQRIFTSRSAVDLLKTLLKVLLLGIVIGSVIAASFQDLLNTVDTLPIRLLEFTAKLVLSAMLWALVAYLFVAAVDYAHQYYEFMKQQRMSKEELRRDRKDADGSPEIRSRRRQMHRMLLRSAPAGRVGGSSVVITNPTHLAIAIAYSSTAGELPYVTAKGEGEVALTIRSEAKRLGIPIVQDVPLARRLYRGCEEGAYIDAAVFVDVARVLASVCATRSSSQWTLWT
jgi:type III secretion protein U